MGSGGPDDNDAQAGRLIAHTLRSEGFDASEDGTGRGTPIVPISADALRGEGTALRPSPDAEGRVRLRDPGLGIGAPGDPAFTLAAAGPGAVAAPLSHGSNPNSNAAGRRREDDENLAVVGPLGGGNDGRGRRTEDDPNLVAGVAFRGRESGVAAELSEGIAPAMRSGKGSASRGSHALVENAVRRLTPVECERLQGFPDGWTDVDGAADSPRYAALGDAVTVNAAEWIGGRLYREPIGASCPE